MTSSEFELILALCGIGALIACVVFAVAPCILSSRISQRRGEE